MVVVEKWPKYLKMAKIAKTHETDKNRKLVW